MARRKAYADEGTDSSDSLLKRIGRVGISGLEVAGNVLGTGGASVRNLLAGKNALTPWMHPISGEGRVSGRDLLRQHRLIGRKDTWGNLAGGIATEFATDPLTVTGNFLGLSAAGKLAKISGGLGEVGTSLGRAGLAGQAITKASELAPHVPALSKALQAGSVADEPLRYAFKVGLPFTEGVGVPMPKLFKGIDLLGEYATKPSRLAPAIEKAAQGLGLAKKAAPAAEPVIRSARPLTERAASAADFLPRAADGILAEHKGVAPWAKQTADVLTFPARAAKMLFHGPTRGKLTEEAQHLAQTASKHADHLRASYVRQAAEKIAPFEQLETEFQHTYKGELDQMFKTNPAATPRVLFERLVSLASETPKGTEHALGEMVLPKNAQFAQKLDSFVEDTRKLMDQMHAEAVNAGLPTGWLSDIASTADSPGFRYMTRAGLERPGGYSLSAGREAPIRHVPAVIGDLMANRVHELQVGGMKRPQIAQEIHNQFGEYLNQASTTTSAGQVPQYADKLEHAKALVDWSLSHGKPGQTFRHDFMQNLHDYVLDHVHKLGNAWALHDLLAHNLLQRPLQAAVKAGVLPKNVEQLRGLLDTTTGSLEKSGTPFVPLKAVFASLADEGIGELAKPGLGRLDPTNAALYLARKLGAPAGMADQWAQTIMEHGALPQSVAKAIQGGADAGRLITHEPTQQLLRGVLDPFTQWIKTHLTIPHLGFLTGNRYSGIYANLASGEIPNPAEAANYIRNFENKYFSRFMKGGFSRAEENEWVANSVLDPHFTGALGLEMERSRFGHVAPGSVHPMEAWKEAGEQLKDAKFAKGPRRFMQAWVNQGAAGNRLVEFLNRVPMYEYLKSKGWSPQQAAKRVAELQVDYAQHNFSPFENEIMTRLLPFYRWHRRMAPVMLQRLLQEPRGLIGQTSRVASAMHEDDPTVPEWIGGTLSIPFPAGVKEPGGKAFITGLRLPQEPGLAYFGGGVRGALRQAASQMHPLVKTPLEWMTNQSFFQEGPGGTGRALDELTPPLGQAAANVLSITGRDASKPVKFPALLEQGIGMTPLTRYLTTARQLTDRRKTIGAKALNLATGIRVANVSPTQQDAALKRRADELLSSLGARRFSESYYPKDRLEGLSPSKRALVENLLDIKRDINKQRKSRQRKSAK